MTAVPGRNGGRHAPEAPSALHGLWFLVKCAAVLAALALLVAVLVGVWAHAVADAFDAGWDWWDGR